MRQEHSKQEEINNKLILVLTEDDLELERLGCIMCGKDIHILFVPRLLTNEELNIVYPNLIDGIHQIGRIKIYK